jgi:hypothetical protein
MVQQANKKRTDKEFQVKNRASQKLAKRFYGPFHTSNALGR